MIGFTVYGDRHDKRYRRHVSSPEHCKEMFEMFDSLIKKDPRIKRFYEDELRGIPWQEDVIRRRVEGLDIDNGLFSVAVRFLISAYIKSTVKRDDGTTQNNGRQ